MIDCALGWWWVRLVVGREVQLQVDDAQRRPWQVHAAEAGRRESGLLGQSLTSPFTGTCPVRPAPPGKQMPGAAQTPRQGGDRTLPSGHQPVWPHVVASELFDQGRTLARTCGGDQSIAPLQQTILRA